MADELRLTVGVEPTLIPGYGGVFDVTGDGKLIFSKSQTGRFPDPGEITRLLQ